MKFIVLVSKDKKHFKLFKLSSIIGIDVVKENSNPEDTYRKICIFQEDSCTHDYRVISLHVESLFSFINGNVPLDNVFVINVDEIEV